MISSLASAVLGIVRWRILFTYFGNSPELGLYLLADRIPSFMFTIIISGAFSLVFIPVLTRLLAHEKEQAYHLVSICFTTLFIAFTSLIILGIIFARPLCELLSVGTLTPDHLQTMVNLLRIMLVAQIGLVVSAFMSAYLQAHRNFVLPALAPLAYWGGYLIVLVALVNANHIYAAAYGMVVGSLLHLLVQLPHAIKLGFRFHPEINFRNKPFKEILALMGPRTIGQFAPELGRVFEGSLAVTISVFSPALLTAAQTLYLFPLNFFAVSIAQAAFPFMSEQSAKKDKAEFIKTLMSTIQQILFFMVPLTFLMVILRLPAVRIVFGSDEFRWESTVLTGLTLAWLCLGMIPESLVHVLVRAFYADHNTRTPLKIGVIATIIQVSIGAYCVWVLHLPIWSLGLAATVGIWIQMMLLMWRLKKQFKPLSWGPERRQMVKIMSNGLISASLTYMLFKMLDRYSWGERLSLGPLSLPTTLYNVIIDTRYTSNLLVFTFMVGAFGLGIYLFIAYLMEIQELAVIHRVVQKSPLKRWIK